MSGQAPLVAPRNALLYVAGMNKAAAPKSKPPTPEQARAGKRLKALLMPLIRQKYGTQEAFAAELEISKAALQAWWKRGTIGGDTIDDVAVALSIPHAAIHAAKSGEARRPLALPAPNDPTPARDVALAAGGETTSALAAKLEQRMLNEPDLRAMIETLMGEPSELIPAHLRPSLAAMISAYRETIKAALKA